MNIALTPDLTRLVKAKVASGQYSSASEVVHEALRLLAGSDRSRTSQVAALRREIKKGLASAKAGHLVDGETAIARLHARVAMTGKNRRRG